MTNYIPNGGHSVTPHLILRNAAEAINFYKKAFGAEELRRLTIADGRVMHATIKIGDSQLMLCDEFPEYECGLSPQSLKNSHTTVHLYVSDVDSTFKKAIDTGAKSVMPPQDMFWGDRYSRLIDPFGQPWSIATHKEDISQAELEKRHQEFSNTGSSKQVEKCN